MIVMRYLIIKLYNFNKQNALKLTLLAFCGLTLISTSLAQNNYDNAVEYFKKTAEEYKLKVDDLEELIVTDQYISKKSGVEHIYVKQALKGIEVNSSNSSIHFTKENLVLVAHNKFISNFKSKIKNSKVLLTAKEAIEVAANDLGLEKPKNLEIVEKEQGKNKKALYSDGGISRSDIPAKLVYHTLKDGSIILSWKLIITEIKESSSWNMYVDVSTGKVIDKIDMVVSCSSECTSTNHNHINGTEAESQFDKKGNENSSSSALSMSGYRVFELPLENPIDNGLNRTLVQSPQSPEASPVGWLDFDNTVKSTFGNNIDAFDTSTGNRASGGMTGLFDFDLDLDGTPADFVDAAITNAFYIGNMAHDILWHHGFDEASGNFQTDNFGNGGQNGDLLDINVHVGNLCNAFYFATPDGTSPFIEMYIQNGRDGAYSNSVLIHEYAHGLSTRLVGGPALVNTIRNRENLGEGWSDIIALILTIKFNDNGLTPQNFGSWFVNNPNGIRPFSGCNTDNGNSPYSTDLGINSFTYGDVGPTLNSWHEIGSLWASMLWEMTWGLIDFYGFNANLYDEDIGGNNIALNLIIEGMKLTPSSPGFIDARDAILRADEALYCGANACIIWEAFAKRGLGIGAQQGSSNSILDQTENFDIPDDCFCCSQFSDWTNNICHLNLTNLFLSTPKPSNVAYEYQAENSICMQPGFEADAQNNLVLLAHIGYCIPNNPLRLGIDVIQEDSWANIYPNPFSSQTTIDFEIENEAAVSIFIADILGKNVATLSKKEQMYKGRHQIDFDGSNLPTGIYYCTIQAGDKIETQKMVLTK